MKTSCEIIKDLLPLYHDNVCSSESRILVEEHVKECASCKKLLGSISEDLARPINTTDEAKPIKAIQAVWKKDKAKSFIKGALITVLICAVLIGGFAGLTQWKVIPVSADLLEVSEVSQLSDGRIIYHLMINDEKNLYFVKSTVNEDGSCYMTPMRSVIEGKRPMELGLFNHYFDLDVAKVNSDTQASGEGTVITSLYVGPLDDGILVWEEGMELPAASEELEKLFSEINREWSSPGK